METRRADARGVRSSTPAAAATGPPRGGASRATIEVVILSEQDRLADRVAAHAAGADAYLAKPHSPLTLLDVVQRLSRG
jgi:CheY-like chemotaxis protein